VKKKTKPDIKVTYKLAKKPAGPEEPVQEATPISAAVEEERVEPQPVKRSRRWPTINRYWLLAGLAVGLIALSIGVGSVWFANPTNQIMGLLTVALFIGGAWLTRRQIKHRYDIMGDTKVNITPTKTSQADGAVEQATVSSNGHEPNSLNIYAIKEGDMIIAQKIAFENVYEPMGQPQKCLNTGKFYHVHIWDIAKGQLVPFILPDSKFTDPAIMARYLGLPSQKKYLRQRESLMHYIGPGILAIMCVAGFIAIIALSG